MYMYMHGKTFTCGQSETPSLRDELHDTSLYMCDKVIHMSMYVAFEEFALLAMTWIGTKPMLAPLTRAYNVHTLFLFFFFLNMLSVHVSVSVGSALISTDQDRIRNFKLTWLLAPTITPFQQQNIVALAK